MELLLAIITCFFIYLSSIIVTYLLSRSDESEVGVLNAFIRFLDSTWKSFLYICETFVSMCASVGPQLVFLWRPLLILALAIAMHEGYEYFLQYSDKCWRCIVYPFVTMFMRSLLHVVRFLYDTVVPMYNYVWLLSDQFFRGSLTIFAKCDVHQFVLVIQMFLRTFLELFKSVFTWVGAGGLSKDNNLMVNEWDIRTSILSLQEAIQGSKELVVCSCSGLSPVWDIAFYMLKPEVLSLVLYHGLNSGLSFSQEIVNAIYSTYPRFRKTVYHLNGAFFHAGHCLE